MFTSYFPVMIVTAISIVMVAECPALSSTVKAHVPAETGVTVKTALAVPGADGAIIASPAADGFVSHVEAESTDTTPAVLVAVNVWLRADPTPANESIGAERRATVAGFG